MEKNFYIYHSFTDEVFKGNPAGVVMDTKELKDEKMQEIAKELGFSETVFLDTKEKMLKVRFFTPSSEVDLCGHATIAYATAMVESGYWNLEEGENRIDVSTNLGILPLVINKREENFDVMMYQDKPQIEKLENQKKIKDEIAKALNIGAYEFLEDVEIVKGYTGLWDLMIGVKSRAILNDIEADMEKIREVSKNLNIISFHIFAIEDGKIYARNMAPIVDIPEESATGTSNGALAYYLYKLGKIELGETLEITQGESMKRKSKILAKVTKDEDLRVLVGGRAVKFVEGKIKIS